MAIDSRDKRAAAVGFLLPSGAILPAANGEIDLSDRQIVTFRYPILALHRRVIDWQFFADWDFNGVYTDESVRLVSASGSMRLHAPASQITAGAGIVDRIQVTLHNAAGRYSPLNTAGALYADIGGGNAYHVPCYLNVSIDGGSNYSRVFTGVMKIPTEVGATARTGPTVTFDCRSRDDLLLQKRLSSTLADFVAINTNGETEEEIIARWLTAAGLTDGTDFVSQAYATANSVTATLDRGFWVIPWAWLDDGSPLEEIWELASACGGRFYCDPAGVFRYENVAHWLGSPHDTSQATLTQASYERLMPRYQDNELFQAVTVEVSGREAADSTELWTAEGVFSIPSGQTRTITAQLRQPAYVITGVTYAATTSGGTNITVNVTVDARTDYAQRLVIVLGNSHATQAANVRNLIVTGQPVESNNKQEEVAESSDSFWTSRTGRNRSVRGNTYIQTGAQGAMLAEFLRDWHERPRLFFQVDGIPGAAGRRLGDRLTVNDTSVMSAARDGFVLSVNWTLGASGFRQGYELVDATSLYPYADTTPGYFIIGTNKLGTEITSTLPGRLFY